MDSEKRLGEWYASFKASPVFIALLVCWVGGWILLHFFLHTDKDWGALNLTLSIESTLSGALLLADIARNEQHRRKQEHINRKLLESMLHLLEAQMENTEDESISEKDR